MLRHATHRFPAITALDVLLPRYHATARVLPTFRVTRATSSTAVLRAGEHERRSHIATPLSPSSPASPPSDPRHSTSSAPSHSTSELLESQSEAKTPPGEEISEADKAALYDELRQSLSAAFASGDIPAAGELWSVLKDFSLLQLLGPYHWESSSRFVADIFERAQPSPLSPSELQTLDEIAVSAAAHGSLNGLRTRMLHLIQQGNAGKVISLFEQLHAVIGEKNAQLDVLEHVTSEEDSETDVLQDKSRDVVHPSIIALAIIAIAMDGSLSLALRTISHAKAPFTNAHTKVYLSDLPIPSALLEKAKLYAQRIVLAQLVSHPRSFLRHATNLSQERDGKYLQRFYQDLISALRDPHPWLTAKPTAVNEKSPVLLPDFVWAILLRIIMQRGDLALAEQLWSDMTGIGVRPSVDTWTALLEGYANLRMADNVLAVWKMMQQAKISHTPRAYRALIHSLFDARRTDEAKKNFRAFQDELRNGAFSLEDSSVLAVHNTVLSWLLLHNAESDAYAVLEEMQRSGPKPDVVSYNSLIRYYAKYGQPASIGTVMRTMEDAGVSPDIVTFSTVLSALLPVNKDAVQIIRGLMEKHGIQMNVTTYTTIIDHLMKENTTEAFEAAFKLLDEMEKEPSGALRPTEVTYTAILAGIHRHEHALEPTQAEGWVNWIVSTMEKRDLFDSKVTYNILLKACLYGQDPDGVRHALRYYRSMVRKQKVITNDTWFILLAGLMGRKQWDVAETIVEDIEQSGRKPSDSVATLMTRVRKRNRTL